MLGMAGCHRELKQASTGKQERALGISGTCTTGSHLHHDGMVECQKEMWQWVTLGMHQYRAIVLNVACMWCSQASQLGLLCTGHSSSTLASGVWPLALSNHEADRPCSWLTSIQVPLILKDANTGLVHRCFACSFAMRELHKVSCRERQHWVYEGLEESLSCTVRPYCWNLRQHGRCLLVAAPNSVGMAVNRRFSRLILMTACAVQSESSVSTVEQDDQDTR